MTAYTPDPRLGTGYALQCCIACGMPRQEHHTDGRCFTLAETLARLEWWQRTGRWPEPDEGWQVAGEEDV